MKHFKIDIADLPRGEREYEFNFDADFFSDYDQSLIDKGAGVLRVTLNKLETFIECTVRIEGQVELICDRSLDTFDYPIAIHRELVIKFSEDEVSEDDDIIFISWNTPSLDLSQLVYELISVEIPMKKLHPRYEDEQSEDELIYTSGEVDEEQQPIDPRWSKLKEIKEDKKK